MIATDYSVSLDAYFKGLTLHICRVLIIQNQGKAIMLFQNIRRTK